MCDIAYAYDARLIRCHDRTLGVPFDRREERSREARTPEPMRAGCSWAGAPWQKATRDPYRDRRVRCRVVEDPSFSEAMITILPRS